MNYNLKKISGDASYREFYRVQKNNKSTIIVVAKKEKFKKKKGAKTFALSVCILRTVVV